MNNRGSKIILEDDQSEFFYKENKLKLNISFNRVSFIFFIFFYDIHYLFYSFNSSRLKEFKN